jgi:hypothetical protein
LGVFPIHIIPLFVPAASYNVRKPQNPTHPAEP